MTTAEGGGDRSAGRSKAERRQAREARRLVKVTKAERRRAREAIVAQPTVGQDSASTSRIRTLRTEWIVPVSQPLLLISQIQRSGGTLLNSLFDDHPSCFAHPYELALGPGEKWRWPEFDPTADADAVFAQFEERWLMRAIAQGFYSKAGAFKGLADEEHQPFIFDRELQVHLFRTQFEARRPRTRREALDQYFTSFFNAWLDFQCLYRGSKQFVTAFTPRVHMHPEHLAAFLNDYPEGFLISAVRDALSWFASARLHSPARYGDLDTAIDLWSASTRATLDAHSRMPGQVVGVLFEDLIQNLEAVMRRICAATGLPFRESLLVPTFNGRPSQSNSSFAMVTDIDRTALDRREHLSAQEMAYLRDKTSPLHEEARARFAI